MDCRRCRRRRTCLDFDIAMNALSTPPINRAVVQTGAGHGGLRVLGIVLPGLVGLTVFFWPVVRSHFTFVPGDIGDARFINFILEHWLQVFRGNDAWLSPPMFYPEKGTLGYSESFFLFVPPYIVARAIGLTLYQSYTVVLAVVLLAGYVGAVWLFHRVMRLALPIAVAGGLIFAYSNIHTVYAGHSQIYAVAAAPWLAGLAIRYARALRKGAWGLQHGISLALLLAGTFYTCFYVGWFIAFFALVAVVVAALIGVSTNRRRLQLRLPRRHIGISASIVLAAFSVGMIPFLITYLPVLRQSGPRGWLEVINFLPITWDYLNVTSTNLVWGRVASHLRIRSHWPFPVSFGIPYLLLLVFFVISANLLLGVMKRRALNRANRSHDAAMLCVAIAVVICWVCMLRIGDLSMWRVVYRLVPGAGAIRVVFRFQVVLELAVIAVAAYGLSHVWMRSRAQHMFTVRAFLVVLLVGLFMEQINTGMVVFDGAQETARLDRIQPAPSDCRRFVVRPRPEMERPTLVQNIDAVLAAAIVGIPTLNGYSGILPKNWGLQNPALPGYSMAVAQWAKAHDVVEGLCQLDLEAGDWRRLTPKVADIAGVNLILTRRMSIEDALGSTLEGFYGEEPIGRWTNGRAAIRFTTPVAGSALVIEGKQWNPLGGQIRISINGAAAFDQNVPALFDLRLPLEHAVREIRVDSLTFVPHIYNAKSPDQRQLGVVISKMEIQ